MKIKLIRIILTKTNKISNKLLNRNNLMISNQDRKLQIQMKNNLINNN